MIPCALEPGRIRGLQDFLVGLGCCVNKWRGCPWDMGFVELFPKPTCLVWLAMKIIIVMRTRVLSVGILRKDVYAVVDLLLTVTSLC